MGCRQNSENSRRETRLEEDRRIFAQPLVPEKVPELQHKTDVPSIWNVGFLWIEALKSVEPGFECLLKPERNRGLRPSQS